MMSKELEHFSSIGSKVLEKTIACAEAEERRLVAETNKHRSWTLKEFMAEPSFQKPRAIVEGLFGKGEMILLTAVSKVGKSFLAKNLALSIASEGEFLGRYRCHRTNVLLLQTEISNYYCRERLKNLLVDQPELVL